MQNYTQQYITHNVLARSIVYVRQRKDIFNDNTRFDSLFLYNFFYCLTFNLQNQLSQHDVKTHFFWLVIYLCGPQLHFTEANGDLHKDESVNNVYWCYVFDFRKT